MKRHLASLACLSLSLAIAPCVLARKHPDHHLEATDLTDDQAVRLQAFTGDDFWERAFGDTLSINKIAYAKDGKWVFVKVKDLRETPNGDDSVVVPAGNYLVKMGCMDFGPGLIPMLAAQPLSKQFRVEAGYDYMFTCARRMRVSVRAMPRAASTLAPIGDWTPPSDPGLRMIPRGTLTLPYDITDTKLMAAAEQSLRNRGWDVTQTHPTWLRGTLHHGDETVVADLVRVGYTLQVVLVDSQNMDFEVKGDHANIDRGYFGWVDNLLNDTAATLGIPLPVE